VKSASSDGPVQIPFAFATHHDTVLVLAMQISISETGAYHRGRMAPIIADGTEHSSIIVKESCRDQGLVSLTIRPGIERRHVILPHDCLEQW